MRWWSECWPSSRRRSVRRCAPRTRRFAHATLVAGYSPTRPVAISGNFDDVEFHTSTVTAGVLTAATNRHSAATLALTEPHEPFIGGVARSGRSNLRPDREDVLVDRDHVVRCSIDLPIAISWDDVDLLVVMFPLEEIAETAAARLGVGREEFRSESTAPASPGLSRFWRTTMLYVDESLRSDDSTLGYPLMQAETVDLLAAAALAVFPNTATTHDYLPGPGPVGPASLRRAVAFIEDNAHRPLTSTEIAEAVGVGPRALQAAFRRHRGRTPMHHLRRVRLEAAHRELQAADPLTGVTVGEIAGRWGFGSKSRFAAAYRDAFGLPPAATLHR